MIVPELVKPETQKLNFLLYGDPGAGKTTFAAQANDHPALRKALFLDFEGGLFAVVGRGDVERIHITSVDQLDNILRAFKMRDPSTIGYNTIVIDSGSELQSLALEEAIGKRGAVRSARSPQYVHDPDQAWQEDYGKITTKLRRIFRYFRDLPVNVIMTALPGEVREESTTQGEPGKVVEISPNFSRALRLSVMGFFDFIWYMYAVDQTLENGDTVTMRSMLTTSRAKYKAKTRGVYFPERLGQRVNSPNLVTIYDLLLASEGASGGLLVTPKLQPFEEIEREDVTDDGEIVTTEEVSQNGEKEEKQTLFEVRSNPFQGTITKGGK